MFSFMRLAAAEANTSVSTDDMRHSLWNRCSVQRVAMEIMLCSVRQYAPKRIAGKPTNRLWMGEQVGINYLSVVFTFDEDEI